MTLNIIRFPNEQETRLKTFAAANSLEVRQSATYPSKKTMELEIHHLPELLATIPELKNCMLLFDASEDVFDAAVTIPAEVDTINLTFWVNIGNTTTQFEKSVTVTEFETLLNLSDLADFKDGRMVREIATGIGWGGETDYFDQDWSVDEWVDEFGNDEDELKKLFPSFILLHGSEIVAESRAWEQNAAFEKLAI